ncbi:MAG TPA: CHAD domain-containing protein [Gemmatimonadales bacterium]|nr:CHAD domain-containing protein [Gemmatimonadales bacterium]
MATFPTDLAQRSAALGARVVALAYLDDAKAALDRLGDAEDVEALHDFRVSLRRLRSTLRAYRPLVEASVRGKDRRRLRAIADATNSGRDAEVQIDWLASIKGELTPRERVGYRWLLARLEARKQEAYDALLGELPRSFTKVDRRLRKGLAVYTSDIRVDGSVPEERFGTKAANAIEQQGEELTRLLSSIQAPDDADLHQARIAAKRLRYLTEPFVERLPSAASLVRSLKALQDVLGEVCDAAVLAADVATGVEAAAAERARQLHELALAEPAGPAPRARRRDERAGLLATARRVRLHRDARFAELEASWLGDASIALSREVAAVAHRLEADALGTAVVPVPVPHAARPRPAAATWRRRAPQEGS